MWRSILQSGFCVGLISAAVPAVAGACGASEDGCAIEGGAYYMSAPDEPARGIAVFLHGAGGSGKKSSANKGLASRFTDRGLAIVFPDGQPFSPDSRGLDWGVADDIPSDRDDVVFLSAVIDDATKELGLTDPPVLITGFSRGGSMAWDFACAAPEKITAIAAVAGAFWEPMVETCDAPVHIHHTHGFADRMVPFEGRQGVFKGFAFHQGNVLKGIDVWREVNGCVGRADDVATEGALWTKVWSTCDAGSITLNVGPGGHGIPKGWSASVLDWFQGLAFEEPVAK